MNVKDSFSGPPSLTNIQLKNLFCVANEVNIDNLKKNYKKIYDKNSPFSFKLKLVDSYGNEIINRKKIAVNFKNIAFINFSGLELNLESNYMPLYTALNTNANVYSIYFKKNILVIYEITDTGCFNQISLTEFKKNIIEVVVHRNTDLSIIDSWFKPGFDHIFKNYIPKNRISLNMGNHPTVLNHKYMIPNISNFIVCRGVSPYRSKYMWEKITPWNKKLNDIVYPATFNSSKDKNQLNFAKLLNPGTVKDYTLVFMGNQNKRGNNNEYINRTLNILDRKNIKYKIVSLQEDINLVMDTFLQSKCLICYGVNKTDRVRVITEGLCANLPFIVNDEIKTIPETYLDYGFQVKNNDSTDLNKKIKILLEKDWGTEPYLFSKNNFPIDKLAKNTLLEINKRVDRSY